MASMTWCRPCKAFQENYEVRRRGGLGSLLGALCRWSCCLRGIACLHVCVCVCVCVCVVDVLAAAACCFGCHCLFSGSSACTAYLYRRRRPSTTATPSSSSFTVCKRTARFGWASLLPFSQCHPVRSSSIAKQMQQPAHLLPPHLRSAPCEPPLLPLPLLLPPLQATLMRAPRRCSRTASSAAPRPPSSSSEEVGAACSLRFPEFRAPTVVALSAFICVCCVCYCFVCLWGGSSFGPVCAEQLGWGSGACRDCCRTAAWSVLQVRLWRAAPAR